MMSFQQNAQDRGRQHPVSHCPVRWGPLMAICGVVVGWWLCCANSVFAQLQAIDVNQFRFDELEFAEDLENTTEPDGGAALKTDPDLEASMATAERFKNDGNYRVATQLWQAILERSGDSLYSKDGQIYFSLARQIEQVLAELPAAGLAAYRVLADAKAKEILAQAEHEHDVIALNQIVQRYFISSLGDDAAFELGCLYLDRFDFIGARRLFEKIIHQYPDPSIPRDQVLLRIALCQSYLDQVDSARDVLQEVDSIAGRSSQYNQVANSLGRLSTRDDERSVNGSWGERALRYGVMPGIGGKSLESDLVAAWQFYFEPRDSYTDEGTRGNLLVDRDSFGAIAAGTVNSVEEQLIKNWQEKLWRPAGLLLFDAQRVYFKTGADLVAWDREKIAAMIEQRTVHPLLRDVIAWRSLWRNAFEIDLATQAAQFVRINWRGSGRNQSNDSPEPTSIPEVQFFGDLIQQDMSLHNGWLYSIEGKPFDDKNRSRSQRVSVQYNSSYRRTRNNFLTAYDAATGQLKFTLPKSSRDESSGSAVERREITPQSQSDWIEGGGFMSAPVGFGGLIMVPVNVGGAISIYALDPMQDGKTVWKSYLCDEPDTGAEAWSPIQLTLDGSDLFVNTGMGVVFVLDPATGMVRFAKRYTRDGTSDSAGHNRGGVFRRLTFSGWSSDVIIPYGRQMICFSSDSQTIEACDRNNGELIWRTDMSPIGFKVDYLLGVYQDVLYAAGRETIVAYDLKGEGRMIWGADQMFDNKQSLGKGVLTPDGIFMPVANSIYHFGLVHPDRDNPSIDALARVQVKLGTSAPVGNLCTDGSRFWVHGGNRLYALIPEPD